ncbi:hypothetical protein [Pseudobacteriovorax antillogorgiicola]|uniref:Uncharacterized protein n=1 Tax=Pseudobacteriovorax antillogorgiicola TaxID=1513793 RepID=A0A1Y6BPR8_9BACT|nr:hypothetical protein [Pseudobacteriovorax antillogorgiicola]TCS53797.1 hypothetical protein EDD56_107106 [Pseudobacteriovorax antillogorgiicola]SMF22159.1 hypothetical protein SAMN06296036_107166 [Pseudobacteriovorax antillogorgiicola]
MINLRYTTISLSVVILALLSNACAFIVEDEPEHYDGHIYFWPDSNNYEFDECRSDSPYDYCGKKPNKSGQDYSWKPNCSSESCQTVGVMAHYQLAEDLGPRATLWIEAYNNPDFAGAAQSTLRISSFDATFPHSTSREEMFLEPGEYYFRAYLSNRPDQALPPALQGMDPVGDAYGIFGAISQPERVLIKPYDMAPMVHIHINRLFEDPNGQIDYNGKMRLNISMPEEAMIEQNRRLVIQLHDNANIDQLAAKQFIMESKEFLIIGQQGKAQFLSPSIDLGRYYLFVFLDSDGNGYYDTGELAYFYNRNGEPWTLSIEEKTTKTLAVPLDFFPILP